MNTLTDTSLTTSAANYVGDTIMMTSGADSHQIATITAYNTGTQTFTVSPSFSSGASGSGSTYIITNPKFIGAATSSGTTTTVTNTGATGTASDYIGKTIVIE